MPSNKQVVIAHFRHFDVRPDERLGNAVFILWVSPEQKYYSDTRNMQAMIDLFNRTVDFRTSEMYTVIAGYLQRSNFYHRRHDVELPNEIDMAARRAMALGLNWYRENKNIISCLGCVHNRRHKIFWQEILLRQEYLAAKVVIDSLYKENPLYADSYRKTSEFFLNSRRLGEGEAERDVLLYNRQEYLREECAFLLALPNLYAKEIKEGKKIYIVYPHNATPAIQATLDLIKERYGDVVEWLCADLSLRNADKFDLPQYLAVTPQCGCSRRIEQLVQDKSRCRERRNFSLLEILNTPGAFANRVGLVQQKKIQLDQEWSYVMLKALSSPRPEPEVFSLWSSFVNRIRELGEISESSSSTSSPSSSALASEDKFNSPCDHTISI